MSRSILFLYLIILSFVSVTAQGQQADKKLQRLKYNNALVADLGVGLWANPLPMDYDNDGDWGLVVSCADVTYNGAYFFENPDGNSRWPVLDGFFYYLK